MLQYMLQYINIVDKNISLKCKKLMKNKYLQITLMYVDILKCIPSEIF